MDVWLFRDDKNWLSSIIDWIWIETKFNKNCLEILNDRQCFQNKYITIHGYMISKELFRLKLVSKGPV